MNCEEIKQSEINDISAMLAAPSEADSFAEYDIRKFQLEKVLHNNNVRKSITLLGTFPYISEKDAAIIILEKQAFRESDVSAKADTVGDENNSTSYFNENLKVTTNFINNIYGSFHCFPDTDFNGVKATVVYPATEKHIQKYSFCERHIVNETPDLYKTVTLPFIISSQISLEWVYNILEHKQEGERIVYEDSNPEHGFVLLPDLKWDGNNVDTLYLLAIPHKRSIKSLRDLRNSHLPLLRNIRSASAEAISKNYGIKSTSLRMYVHYQPTFYHFHVHINIIRNEAPGILCEKSHMLDSVINNLELLSDYYERASIPFQLYEGNKLLDLFDKELHILQEVKPRDDSKDAEDEDVKLDAK